MPAKLSSVSFDFTAKPDHEAQPAESGTERPFNIVVMGDFAGRGNRGVCEALTTRKLAPMDVDNFARVLEQLGAKLRLAVGEIPGMQVELSFRSLDDFHPDRILVCVPSLAIIAEARRLILNPATAEQGKAMLQAHLGDAVASPTGPTTTTAPATATTESDDQMLARLMGGAPPATAKTEAPKSQAEQLIQQIVAPHVIPAAGAWQSGALAAAELELTDRLDAIVHHPDFQALEASWRGADLLIRRIESSEEITLNLLDVSLAELETDLDRANQVEESALFRLLHDHKPSLLIGNYTFGRTAEDLRTLGKVAELAVKLRAPFVATASSQLAGCDSIASHPDPDDWKLKLPAPEADVWESLRQAPQAAYVGLAAPRFLLRQPYGKTGDAIESFPFDELPCDPVHESFLWGHPGILFGCVVIDALQAGVVAEGEFSGGEVSDLPVHKFTEDGEIVVKSYAEVWLTDRAADRLLDKGILPIVPVKNQNLVRLNHLRSIAHKPTALPIG